MVLPLVTAIFTAIASFPKLLEMIEQLAAFIGSQVQVARNNKAISDAAIAATKAQETKDTSGLDQAFDPDKK